MNEGVVGQAIRRSVLDSIEEGIIVNSKWYDCESYEQVRNSLDDVAGSNEERNWQLTYCSHVTMLDLKKTLD